MSEAGKIFIGASHESRGPHADEAASVYVRADALIDARERLATARNDALEEAAKAIECLLPEHGARAPQDDADKLIDGVRRDDARAIRALKSETTS